MTTAVKESPTALIKTLSENEGLVAFIYKNNKPKYELL
jgi:hypothetical protein